MYGFFPLSFTTKTIQAEQFNIFGTFKVLVLGTGMFLAIKSHYDGEKKEKKEKEKEMNAPQ